MMGKEAKARQHRKELRAAGIESIVRHGWTKEDEARYRHFNSIREVKVPDPIASAISGKPETSKALMHRGRLVSERYVKRMAKKELYDMQVRAKNRKV